MTIEEKTDVLDFVRQNRKMYLNFAEVTGFELCSKILIDAITNDAQPVMVDTQEDWWIVASQESWIIDNVDEIPISDLFGRMNANQRAGQNAIRNEILLAAFADQIVLFQDQEIKIIRINDEHSLPNVDIGPIRDFKFGIAFTLP